MRFPPATRVFLRTLMLLMLVVGTAVRPTLVMICELQGAFAGAERSALVDAPAAAHAGTDQANGDDHPGGHAHGSHGILQNIAPDGVAAILPAFELPVLYPPSLPMPDLSALAPPPRPTTQPFRPPIA